MKRFAVSILLTMTIGCATSHASHDLNATAITRSVVLTDDGNIYTLSNGLVTVKIVKRTGEIGSLVYHNIETLSGGLSRPNGRWSHSAASRQVIDTITIDPKTNNGQRAEVSIKGISNGNRMGAGPGGSMIADIEIRYTLERNTSGIYTYCIFDHKPEYPQTSVGEARFYVKLSDDVFDWMTVDANRNLQMITTFDWNHGTVMNMKEARLMNTGIYKGQVEHKYDYSASQFDTLAWGWSSTKKQIGFWFINPTVEYLSGGPTKNELSAHRDATFTNSLSAPAPPCLLNYWRSSHYGGSSLVVAQGEHWNKVVGPFLIYCNSGESPDAMWKDALDRSSRETKAWPYNWPAGIDYPHKSERATVNGQLILNDPQAQTTRLPNLLVGLTWPDYTVRGGRNGPTKVDWQTDAKHYEFWARGDENGYFSIPNVRPGNYTLHAIADGVLGDFSQADITVKPGQPLNLGQVQWMPVRYGRQLWDIGVPNRSASEFLHGDNYWHWGLYLQYPKDFPDDVHYIVGKSDYHTDWNYAHVPRATDKVGRTRGTATTWTISFNVPQPEHGKATLRLPLCASTGTTIYATLNGKAIGDTGRLPYNATINRDGIRGNWFEKDIIFNAALIKAGNNDLKLTVPIGGVTNGIEYDYVRLELDENARMPAQPATMPATTSASTAPSSTTSPITMTTTQATPPTTTTTAP